MKEEPDTLPMQLDPLDARIVRLLMEDARLSYREIARRLRSTTPTVSARVRRLEQLGVIRGYRADVHPSIVGEGEAPARRTVSLPRAVDVPCHQCRGPIAGEPVTRALGGMAHVFCCRHCMGTFVKRYEALKAA